MTADIERNVAAGNEFWMDTITPNPTQQDVYNGLKLIEGCDPDFILAIGGGSAIDTSKGISNFHYLFKGKEITIEAITDLLKSGAYKAEHEVIDIISVPSAAGTGSEVTQFATIWDINKTAKFSIDTPQNYPKMSLIIPELTLTLPLKMTFSTGVDALSHAIESYWAKPTTYVVKDIALKAIETIMTYLPKVWLILRIWSCAPIRVVAHCWLVWRSQEPAQPPAILSAMLLPCSMVCLTALLVL